jgi:hypothetical protein
LGVDLVTLTIHDSDDRALEQLSKPQGILDELSSALITIMNSITHLTPQQLRQAADIQEKVLVLQNELERLLGSSAPETAGVFSSKRRLSAQGLANIRAGARKRWARERGDNGVAGPSKPRRKMSAAGRARIAAQLRARWAAAKRAGRNAL